MTTSTESNTKATSGGWKVQVIQDSTGEVVQTMPASSERDAERIQRGVEINLNHEAYSTKVVDSDGN